MTREEEYSNSDGAQHTRNHTHTRHRDRDRKRQTRDKRDDRDETRDETQPPSSTHAPLQRLLALPRRVQLLEVGEAHVRVIAGVDHHLHPAQLVEARRRQVQTPRLSLPCRSSSSSSSRSRRGCRKRRTNDAGAAAAAAAATAERQQRRGVLGASHGELLCLRGVDAQRH